jgi:hypothetical protein
VLTDDLVGNCIAHHSHRFHIFARIVQRLSNGIGHRARLTNSKTDTATIVADYNYDAECEAASTLDHFGYTVDVDYSLI